MSWDDFYPDMPHPDSAFGWIREKVDRGALLLPDRIPVLPAFMRPDSRPKFSEPPLGSSNNPHLTIIGGTGGTAARLEDLAMAASVLDDAGADLKFIRSQCSQLASEIDSAMVSLRWRLRHSLAKVHTYPLLAAQIEVLLGEVEFRGRPTAEAADVCVSSAATVKSDTSSLARAVRSARKSYLEAEAEAERALADASLSRAIRTGIGNARPFDPFMWGSTANKLLITGAKVGGSKALDGAGRLFGKNFGLEDRLAANTDDLVDDSAYALLALTPFGAGVEKGGAVERLAAVASKLARSAGQHPHRQVQVNRARGPQGSLPVAHDVQGAARTVEALTGRGGAEPGTIALQKNTLPNGDVNWFVMLPGTQGGLTEEHGSDWTSNAQLISGEISASVQVVEQAMEQAGVQRGEQVFMIGHSQGGLAATYFAALPKTRAKYDIKHVVTLGSPVGKMELNPVVEYLNVESTRDVVPSADGIRNLDEVNRTTVVADSAHLVGPSGELEVGAHSLTGYGNVLEQTAASEHPSTKHFFKGVEDYFDGSAPEGRSQILYFRGKVTQK